MTTDTKALSYDHIVALALEHGFKLKPQVDGRMALNDYVIDFARAVYDIGHAAAKAETAAPVVGRWYFVANDGAATLCVDEADARESAAEADIAFPRMAPHRAVQLVPADQLAAAGEPVAWCIPNDPCNATAFAWPGTDRTPQHNVPLFTADQLAAAVAAERERAATVVDEKIGSVRKANPGRGGRINSAVAFALDALGDCADAIRAGAKEPNDG